MHNGGAAHKVYSSGNFFIVMDRINSLGRFMGSIEAAADRVYSSENRWRQVHGSDLNNNG